MTYTVTVENFPEFIAKFATQVATHKSVEVDIHDTQLYEDGEEYLSWKTQDIISMWDFITNLKDRYTYPQA